MISKESPPAEPVLASPSSTSPSSSTSPLPTITSTSSTPLAAQKKKHSQSPPARIHPTMQPLAHDEHDPLHPSLDKVEKIVAYRQASSVSGTATERRVSAPAMSGSHGRFVLDDDEEEEGDDILSHPLPTHIQDRHHRRHSSTTSWSAVDLGTTDAEGASRTGSDTVAVEIKRGAGVVFSDSFSGNYTAASASSATGGNAHGRKEAFRGWDQDSRVVRYYSNSPTLPEQQSSHPAHGQSVSSATKTLAHKDTSKVDLSKSTTATTIPSSSYPPPQPQPQPTSFYSGWFQLPPSLTARAPMPPKISHPLPTAVATTAHTSSSTIMKSAGPESAKVQEEREVMGGGLGIELGSMGGVMVAPAMESALDGGQERRKSTGWISGSTFSASKRGSLGM